MSNLVYGLMLILLLLFLLQALTDVDEVCIDPMHQKKVFQLERGDSVRSAKKHRGRKVKQTSVILFIIYGHLLYGLCLC